MPRPVFFAIVGSFLFSISRADEPSAESIRAALDRALPPLEASASQYTNKRNCFSCHHQTMPLLAMSIAKRRGFDTGESIDEQIKFIDSALSNARENYKKGRGLGGGIETAGSALWALDLGAFKPDETSAAVATYLLEQNPDKPEWRTSSKRPPSEGSPYTTIFLAIRGMQAYGTPDQKSKIAERVAKSRDWLIANKPKTDENNAFLSEDRVFRLWALKLVEAPAAEIEVAAKELKAAQNRDGSWSQLPNLPGDAYATGAALVALNQTVGLPATDPDYRRGLAFLIKEQKPDGTWYVKSRSKPFQTYFESGFPYKGDQFISAAASGWAAAALALAVDPK